MKCPNCHRANWKVSKRKQTVTGLKQQYRVCKTAVTKN